MKKHNAVKVVLIAFLVCLILSWVIPAAYFSESFVDQGLTQMGLFDLVNYPVVALSYFGNIVLYFILIGAFYGILYKIPAYRTFLDRTVAKLKGKEKFVISLVMILIALAVSICGVDVEIFFFFPLIISIILLMGYDKIVVALTLVGSVTVGMAGSTFAYNKLSILLSALSLDFSYAIGIRFVILAVGLVLLIFNTMMYIKKNCVKKVAVKETVKVSDKKEEVVAEKVEVKTTTKSSSKSSSGKSNGTKKSTSKKSSTKSKSSKKDNKAAYKDEDVLVVNGCNDEYLIPSAVEGNNKIWPLVVSFIILFVIMVLAFVSWGEGGFGLTTFTKATSSVTEFEVFKFAIFGKILGTTNAFGAWTMIDYVLVMAVVVLFLAIVYKVKFDDILDGFAQGAVKALAPAVIVIIAYAILVTVTYHPFQLTIYKAILGLSKSFNVATTALVAFLASILNIEPNYVFQSVLPYYVSLFTNTDNYQLVALIFQSMYGLTMIVAPTSIVLLTVLSVLKVNYLEWLKKIWKFAVEFFAVLIIIFIILACM